MSKFKNIKMKAHQGSSPKKKMNLRGGIPEPEGQQEIRNLLPFQVIQGMDPDNAVFRDSGNDIITRFPKPSLISEMGTALEKMARLFGLRETHKGIDWLMKAFKTKPTRVAIRSRSHEGDVTKYLEAAKISYAEAFGSSVKFFLTDGNMIISGKTLGHYHDTLLTRFDFIKVGRSFIVNPAEIDSFNNSEGYLILKTPLKINSGHTYKIHVSRDSRHKLLEYITRI